MSGTHADTRGAALTVPDLLERAIWDDWPLRLLWPKAAGMVADTGRFPPALHNSTCDTVVIPRELIAELDTRPTWLVEAPVAP